MIIGELIHVVDICHIYDIYQLSPDDFSLLLQKLAARLKKEAAINQLIANVDPLGADEAFQRLPVLNESHNIEGIRQLLAATVTKASDLSEGDFADRRPAISEICMFGASLVRFEREPADCMPGFSEVLLALSSGLATPIPRDSFVDYTSRNPADERERTFTSLPQEKLFIDSLRQGMFAWYTCWQHMMFPSRRRSLLLMYMLQR
ncbi:MAG TPA: monodechloroaminopyrrolnitrin synthase PrnB family protein [Ktedonobacteraceae bacterium]